MSRLTLKQLLKENIRLIIGLKLTNLSKPVKKKHGVEVFFKKLIKKIST
jgi:hypothetical protein